MFGNTRWPSLLGLVLLVLTLSARQAAAAPIVDVTVTNPSAGLYEYSYTLTNPAGSDEVIYDFGLFFAGDPLDIVAPADWDIFFGNGFINWFSMLPLQSDVFPGSSLGGFSFRSTFAPGDIEFETTTGDLLTGFPVTDPVRGIVAGPAATPSVPEPATLAMLTLGAAGAWRMRRRAAEKA